jgi:hypothetical protein
LGQVKQEAVGEANHQAAKAAQRHGTTIRRRRSGSTARWQRCSARTMATTLLGLVAGGLIAYGLYCFVEARYREV